MSEVFKSNCGVDNIYKDVDEEGQVLENKTRVFTHFLDGDIPVNAEIINAYVLSRVTLIIKEESALYSKVAEL